MTFDQHNITNQIIPEDQAENETEVQIELNNEKNKDSDVQQRFSSTLKRENGRKDTEENVFENSTKNDELALDFLQQDQSSH